jgi:hypothetical protein
MSNVIPFPPPRPKLPKEVYKPFSPSTASQEFFEMNCRRNGVDAEAVLEVMRTAVTCPTVEQAIMEVKRRSRV